jgi:hypothetical protein
MEKHKFAKDCKKVGGLFKCCIRRDAAFCHECRYPQTREVNLCEHLFFSFFLTNTFFPFFL